MYTLDRPGAELVGERLGLEPEELDWKPGGNVVSSIFLEHLLSTNDVGVAVIRAARRHQWAIREWRGEDVLKRPQMKDVVTLVGPQGGENRAAVVPDAYFRLDTGEDIYNFFLEIDRSTASGQASKWGRRDWARKVKAYLAYCRTGKYEKRYKTADLRILTVTTSERRLLNLKAITEQAGGRGRFWLTTTGLTSEAQPFIRYRTGDVMRLSSEPAAGGQGLHVIAEVTGRQTDFVVAADGRVMHALAVIYVLRAVPGIAQFKCIQHALDRMEVQIVPDAGWNEAARDAVVAGLHARLGETLKVEMRMLDEIPPVASGKHRYVVSHVQLAESLKQAAE